MNEENKLKRKRKDNRILQCVNVNKFTTRFTSGAYLVDNYIGYFTVFFLRSLDFPVDSSPPLFVEGIVKETCM